MRIRESLRWFLDGMGSITLFLTLPEIDLGDIAGDWKAIGEDIQNAIKNYGESDII